MSAAIPFWNLKLSIRFTVLYLAGRALGAKVPAQGLQCGPVGGIRIEDGRLEFYKYERDYWSCTDCVWVVENIPTNEVITLVDLNMSIGDTIFFQKMWKTITLLSFLIPFSR